MFYKLKYCRYIFLTYRKMPLKIMFIFNIIKLKEKIDTLIKKIKNHYSILFKS